MARKIDNGKIVGFTTEEEFKKSTMVLIRRYSELCPDKGRTISYHRLNQIHFKLFMEMGMHCLKEELENVLNELFQEGLLEFHHFYLTDNGTVYSDFKVLF